MKIKIGVLQNDPRKPVKYWMLMCAPTYQSFAQKSLWYHFCDDGFCNLSNFQILLQSPKFLVVKKRLVYERVFIFYIY